MKKKRCVLLLSVIALVAILSLGFAACNNTADEQETPVPQVTISRSSVTVDMYDTVTLTAQTENTEDPIVWSSGNEAIATVANGVVKGISEGETDVTASAGGAQAVCRVTVRDSGEAAILRVSAQSVTVKENQEKTVSATAVYKGAEVEESVAFSWTRKVGETEEIASVAVSEDTKSATVKGLRYSESTATFIVSATVRGTFIAKEITVSVCNTDIEFSLSGLDAPSSSGYSASLALKTVGQGETHTKSVNTALSVRDTAENEDIALSKLQISYKDDGASEETQTSQNLTFESGVITAIKAGETEIVLRYAGNNAVIFVHTYRPVLSCEVNENGKDYFEIETKRDTQTANDNITLSIEKPSDEETVQSVTLNGKTVGDTSYEIDENESSITIATLPQYGYAALGDGELRIVTDMAEYVYKTQVITKKITTATELLAMQAYGDYCETEKTYGGYFVLGNNIDLGETDITGEIKFEAHYSAASADNSAEGFHGVFDGRGYSILNGIYYQGANNGANIHGLFGTVSTEGIIKNVAFVGASAASVRKPAGVIACNFYGELNNVFIHTDGNYNLQAIGYHVEGATLTDVVIYNPVYDAANADGTYAVANFSPNSGQTTTAQNTFVFTEHAQLTNNPAKLSGAESLGQNAADHGITDKTFADGTYWCFDYTVPLFETAKTYFAFTPDPVLSVETGGNRQISANKNITLTVKSIAPDVEQYVSVSGGTVTVDKAFIGMTVFTLDILNAFGESSVVDVVAAVPTEYSKYTDLNADNKRVANTADIAMDFGMLDLSGATFTLNSSYTLSGESVSVQLAPEVNGNGITLKNADVQRLSEGDYTLTVSADGKTYPFSVKIVTKKIATATELLAMQAYGDYNDTSKSYGGYFVLGNNIDLDETDITGKIKYAPHYSAASADNLAEGFHGVFDGRGYSILNGIYCQGTSGNNIHGLFGTVSTEGIIKNVAFVGASVASVRKPAGIIACNFYGELNNVFIHTDGNYNLQAIGYHLEGATLKDMVIYNPVADAANASGTYAVANFTLDGGDITIAAKTYVFTDHAQIANKPQRIATATKYALTETNHAVTGFTDNAYWDFDTFSIPVFASATEFLQSIHFGETTTP